MEEQVEVALYLPTCSLQKNLYIYIYMYMYGNKRKEKKNKMKRMQLKRIRLLTCVHSKQQRRIPVVFSVNFFTQRVQQKPAQYILSTLSWASRIYC